MEKPADGLVQAPRQLHTLMFIVAWKKHFIHLVS